MAVTYREAGVDVDEGDALVERIKPFAARTMRPEVLAGIGGFGGLFALPPGKYKEPVLVSGTDGVGTKLKVALAAGRHGTIGQDLVAMCANDVAVCGAEALFFLDYFATSRLRAPLAAEVIEGIAKGCELAGCALLGGETAELPGVYAGDEYDLAGFCVGVVERSRMIDGSRVRAGDALVGLGSTGLHSNGYSLARRVLLDAARLPLEETPAGLSRPLGDELLEPTRIYVKDLLALAEAVDLRAAAHITGSGLPGNVPRVLPPGTRARLRTASWPRPPIFDLIAKLGPVEPAEMYRAFNMGLGMVLVVPPADVAKAIALCEARGVPAFHVGVIESAPGLAEPEVIIE